MKADKQSENLANAIILQAIDDWKDCIKNEKGEYEHPKDKSVNRKEIERFFRSEWFTTLSDVDPEYIIELLKRTEERS